MPQWAVFVIVVLIALCAIVFLMANVDVGVEGDQGLAAVLAKVAARE